MPWPSLCAYDPFPLPPLHSGLPHSRPQVLLQHIQVSLCKPGNDARSSGPRPRMGTQMDELSTAEFRPHWPSWPTTLCRAQLHNRTCSPLLQPVATRVCGPQAPSFSSHNPAPRRTSSPSALFHPLGGDSRPCHSGNLPSLFLQPKVISAPSPTITASATKALWSSPGLRRWSQRPSRAEGDTLRPPGHVQPGPVL